MLGQWKRGVTFGLTLMLASAVFMAGCSKLSSSGTDKSAQSDKQVKLRVMIYDRGNAPDGMKLTEAPLIKWAQQQVKPLGIDLDFVPVPRGEAENKLNVWLASGEAPDIIFTYELNTLFKYAQQGGLWQLGELLDKYGPQIVKNNQKALEQAGNYEGKRYAIPALRANPAIGPALKIRQDWLDKLGLKAPETVDELYRVLKTFKEKDPGNVGKDKVVPMAFPAIGKAFMYALSGGFGINPKLQGNGTDMFGGVWKDDRYISAIASEGGREMMKFLNKLYKEELIPREFGTDVNSLQFNQYIAQGVTGVVENNDSGWSLTDSTRRSVPEARWLPFGPLRSADGNAYAGGAADYGMLIMLPKASREEQAIAAVKYLNWMADPKIIKTLQSGIEGVHYQIDADGITVPINVEKNKREIEWYAGPGDLEIIQQGQPAQNYEYYLKAGKKNPAGVFDAEYYAKVTTQFMDMFIKNTPKTVVITDPRPFAQKNQAAIQKFLNESITKVIVAADPDKEYDIMIDGWKKLGGEEFDKEMTEAYKHAGYKP
ncbi:extracellular solute-binding protein [Paenibacillus cymbidii]|uniref:extracellular solute-binding protein n=1 Tax=Paenibacillus cymbidii TaxID=1639034 RepID=UPI00108195D4|nr:extracellular solute-binding protein [Paenibacillus cymbidii]